MKILESGDVIQVRENVAMWSGCLLIVDKVRPWGVQAYMRIPGQETRTAFIRLKHEQYYYIGQAEVVHEVNNGSV